MMTIQNGERIGKQGKLLFGCSAVIFDEKGEKILLMQRDDNFQWCLPGGAMNPGESIREACIREVWEETGLHISIKRMIGVYSSPHSLVVYPDGNKYHVVSLCFEGKRESGALCTSEESLDLGYFSREEMQKLELLANHVQRIEDAYRGDPLPCIR